MKKAVIGAMILSFLVVSAELTFAAQEVSPSARQEAEAKAKQILSSKEWAIYLTAMGEKKAKTETDALIFTEGKVTSKNLSAKGYPTTNYTATVQENGTIVWETMQTAEKGGTAFYRGELEGQAMRGVLSLHSSGGEARNFSFTTTALAAEKKVEPVKK